MRVERVVASWLVVLCLACGGQAPAAPEVTPPGAQPQVEAKPAPVEQAVQPAAAQLTVAALGAQAPDFVLPGVDGKTHKLSDHKGKIVVLEWFNPDCPFVRHAHSEGALKTMAKRVAGPDIVWLSINSGGVGKQGHGAERNAAALGEYAMDNAILLDESGATGRAYGAVKTPHLFIVDKNGTLVYRGGIDNAPIGRVDTDRPVLPDSRPGDLVNYVDAALEDLRAGRPLRLPDAPPYGCSVKYQG